MSDDKARQVIESWNERIAPLDQAACARARDKWNAVAKPIGALGFLEDEIVQIAGLTGTEDFSLGKRIAVIMCADNGVIAQGVTQCGNEVTCAVAEGIGQKTSSVCAMATPLRVETMAVDIGMAHQAQVSGVVDRCVARGTADITQGPAMTFDQALQALQTGIDVVGELREQGYGIIAVGEMGIGNTTTASALVSALLGMPVEEAVGRGAGLSDEGLVRKVQAVRAALEVNGCAGADAFDALCAVGGFDIAGMAGLYIGGAIYRIPVVVDGYISMVAAYIAASLCPACAGALFGSHISTEPATQCVYSALCKACAESPAGLVQAGLQFRAVIDAGMHLGEGTGAVCLVPLLDAALSLYNGRTFNDAGIDAYEVDLR